MRRAVRWAREHSLSLAVAALLVLAICAWVVLGGWLWQSLPTDSRPNRAPFVLAWTAQALISGSFNALVLVLLTKWFREPGSAESR